MPLLKMSTVFLMSYRRLSIMEIVIHMYNIIQDKLAEVTNDLQQVVIFDFFGLNIQLLREDRKQLTYIARGEERQRQRRI